MDTQHCFCPSIGHWISTISIFLWNSEWGCDPPCRESVCTNSFPLGALGALPRSSPILTLQTTVALKISSQKSTVIANYQAATGEGRGAAWLWFPGPCPPPLASSAVPLECLLTGCLSLTWFGVGPGNSFHLCLFNLGDICWKQFVAIAIKGTEAKQ